MIKINERKKTLEVVLEQKTKHLQQIEAVRNSTVTEIVQLQGKIELLNELEHESSVVDKKEEKKEDSV